MILICDMAPRVEEDSGANQHKLNDEGVETTLTGIQTILTGNETILTRNETILTGNSGPTWMILICDMPPRVEEDCGANQHKLNDERVENRGGRLQTKR